MQKLFLILISLMLIINNAFADLLIDNNPPWKDNSKIRIGVLLFPKFETLDVFGPVEIFGSLPDKFEIIYIGTYIGVIDSDQGVPINVIYSYESHPKIDMMLIPGGQGVRNEINNLKLLNYVKLQANKVSLVISVCTGAALLAKSGVLDYRRATTNKQVFSWVESQSQKVKWSENARWVDDGNIITSSGVAAGIDMSLYIIKKMYGESVLHQVENYTEYQFSDESTNDYFIAH